VPLGVGPFGVHPLLVEELGDIFAVQFDATAARSFNENLQPPDMEKAVMSAWTFKLPSLIGKATESYNFPVKEFLTSE
jgi:hypothetical protein